MTDFPRECPQISHEPPSAKVSKVDKGPNLRFRGIRATEMDVLNCIEREKRGAKKRLSDLGYPQTQDAPLSCFFRGADLTTLHPHRNY